MTIVGVTGASGMVGRHLEAALTSRNIESLKSSRLPNSAEAITGWDLSDWKTIDELDYIFPECNCLVHAGAYVPKAKETDPSSVFDVNVRATYNLSQWARKRGIHFVLISGGVVYQNPFGKNIRETAKRGFNEIGKEYGASKFLSEEIIKSQMRRGLHATILRPSSIYGHSQEPFGLVDRLLLTSLKDSHLSIEEPVNDSFNLIHAADLANAILKVVEKKVTGVFNISAKRQTTLIELASSCLEVTGKGSLSVIDKVKKRNRGRALFNLNSSLADDAFSWSQSIELLSGLEMTINKQLLVK